MRRCYNQVNVTDENDCSVCCDGARATGMAYLGIKVIMRQVLAMQETNLMLFRLQQFRFNLVWFHYQKQTVRADEEKSRADNLSIKVQRIKDIEKREQDLAKMLQMQQKMKR